MSDPAAGRGADAGADVDADMDEEMRLHVALLTEKNVAAGMTAGEARRAALLAFGPAEAIREAARATRRFAWLHDLGRDAAYGARMLRREPRLSAVLVLTLALGIGACVAVFSVVSSVLLRPLAYPEADRLVVLHQINPPRFPEFVVLPAAYREWQRRSTSFEGLAAVRTRSYNLTGGAVPIRVSAARITANTLSTLRVRPALGRDFFAEEELAGKGNVVILDHRFWQRRFGGRADVLGQIVRLDGQPFAVVGVMAPGFQLGDDVDLLAPAAYTDADPQNRLSLGAHSMEVFGRLAPGVTLAAARTEMSLVAARLASAAPREKQGWGVKLTPLLEARVGDARPVLLSLGGAVAFLLLIACANAANLLLARGTARAREIAVRAALGASRGRIVRQLVTESVLVALGAGVLGLSLAYAGGRALLGFAPDSLPRAAEIAVDLRALGFTCGLALVTGVGFGLTPALAAARLPLHDALKEGGRSAGEGGPQRLRAALVVVEIALALILLAGAGLLIRSFARLETVERGFEPRDAVTFGVSLAAERYDTDARRAAFAAGATARLTAIPGVVAAGASQVLPFSVDLNMLFFEIVGHPAPSPSERPTTYVFQVTPGYLEAMGIPLLRGRAFDARDVAGAAPVLIINESMARKYFAGEDPIGKRVRDPERPTTAWADVVGVVADVKDGVVYKVDAGAASMQIYVPFAQNAYDTLAFVVRTAPRSAGGREGERDRGPSPALAAAIRAAIDEVDGDQAIAAVRPLGDLVARSIARQRFAMLLFAVFSGVALLLAALGIYGVMGYAVARRTAEIGIRMALGAQPGDVLRLVLVEGGRLIALGLGAGIVGALALTRFMASLLFGVTPTDPLTFAAIAALLAVAGGLACLGPARRATRVDPMTALRAG